MTRGLPWWHRLVNFCLRLPTSLMSRIRAVKWRLLGATVGSRCRISSVEVARNPWDIELRDLTALDHHVVLLTTGPPTGSPRIVLGPSCYINRFTMFDASERIEVGRGTMIGPYCYITDHDHGISADTPVAKQPLIGSPVVIGKDVWLGAGVKVLKGVTIGDGTIVGAGSVVTKSLPAGVIAAGVPARVIGERG